MTGHFRRGLPLVRRVLSSDTIATAHKSAKIFSPILTDREFTRNDAAATAPKDQQVNVIYINIFRALSICSLNNVRCVWELCFGLVAVKANVLDKVESELLTLVEASKRSPTFSQFMEDLLVTAEIRVKAINDICAQAKFSDITKNFFAVVAESGRLAHIERMAQRFAELSMAHKGELKPLPPEEEKELKETLQDIIGHGKKVKVAQKIDASILGGLVVEFGQKVFDMSIRTRARQMEQFLREPVST